VRRRGSSAGRAALLRLIDALAGVEDCEHCSPQWRWQPLLFTGIAYHSIGVQVEGSAAASRALALLAAIPDPGTRLRAQGTALSHMLVFRHDPVATRAFRAAPS